MTPAPASIDLRSAVVVTSARPTAREKKAVQVLVEEVQKRTLITLPVATSATAGRPSINIGRIGSLPGGARSSSAGLSKPGAEGFQLVATGSGAAAEVTVAGADERGVLFGVGRLLRELRMDRGTLAVAPSLRLSTTPQTPLRGHQLGYRPKTNSYDGWTVAMWDQYIRDLAVFGNNAIELIPPRSDDDADSPHFPLPPIEMMVEMSRIADEYGLDVWIWYPALDKDYGDPATVDFAVKEWAEVFKRLPRIDAILVPGGDPGRTEPRHMFTLLERQTASLRQFHPKATMWLSPQGFTVDWMNQFYDLMAKQPAWLTGLVFGPQVRDPLPTLARRSTSVTRFADTRHHPQPARAVSRAGLGHRARADVEPRADQPSAARPDRDLPRAGRARHRLHHLLRGLQRRRQQDRLEQSGLGPERGSPGDAAPVQPLLHRRPLHRQLRAGAAVARAQLARPARQQRGRGYDVAAVPGHGADAAPRDLLNWRFQQALYRAYYDAYVRQRLLYERALEADAMTALSRGRAVGALAALDAADAALARATTAPAAAPLRARVGELADALFQSIRMQLAVKPYGAIAVGRGATLDTVDMPLNDRVWLAERFKEIRGLAKEDERLAAIDTILRWTDPGPGGFYDDLGDPSRQPHLVRVRACRPILDRSSPPRPDSATGPAGASRG